MNLGKFSPLHKDFMFNSSNKNYTFLPSKLKVSEYKKPLLKGRWKKYKQLSIEETKNQTLIKDDNNNNDKKNNYNNNVLKIQPNTFRTINPELQSPKRKKLSRNYALEKRKSSGDITPNYSNPLINYSEDKKKSKTMFKNSPLKNKSNFKFFYDKNELNDTYRRIKRKNILSKYELTTQIYSLPGGVKREIPKKYINPILEECKSKKIVNDYKSKISCLNNSMTFDLCYDVEQNDTIKSKSCRDIINWNHGNNKNLNRKITNLKFACNKYENILRERNNLKKGKKHIRNISADNIHKMEDFLG